jgi:tetratricopeptide (TPR) repeat protein
MKNKTIVALVVVICLSAAAFAGGLVSTENWRILEDGKIAFEDGENGEALALCEKARIAHAAMISRYASALEKSLEPREVRKAGDKIDSVREVLVAREDFDAVAIIDRVLEKKSKESLGNSISALITWINSNGVYPETNILAGKVYEAEGEPNLALSQYETAWKFRDLLDIPDARYDLAYRMSDLSFNFANDGAIEKYLMLVVEGDPLFGKSNDPSPSLKAMMRTLDEEKTVDKFFLLYRHSNYRALKAYQDLSSFYIRSNRADRTGPALPVATLAAVITVTRMTDLVKQKDLDYSYDGLPDLFTRFGIKSEYAEWASENRMWSSFSTLARVLQLGGMKEQAQSLWTVLANYCPDPATVRAAKLALANGRK